MIQRCDKNAGIIFDFVRKHKWIRNLAVSSNSRSNTSVCLVFVDSRIQNQRIFAENVCLRLEDERVAFDIRSYRDAPPGLRIWCGGTINPEDVKLLMTWINWAYKTEISKLN